MQKIIQFTLFLFVISCAQTQKIKLGDNSQNLTQSYADFRATQVSDVDYDLDFDISEKKESYSGTSRISFIPLHNKKDLRVDFYQGKVKGIKINGKAQLIQYNGAYITIPAEKVVGERVVLEIAFEHSFSKSGRGFHRAVDPKDQRIYLHTNLEPFDANQVFPCFDQPNLKASYAMKVKAPKKWQVITSVRESHINKEKNYNSWTFPKSARFSTYIWSLHAGDYHVWQDTKFRYPMRLFARKSLAKWVKPKDWFNYTRASFDYFDNYFAYPYPYKKYDQIIVPEFFSGAMENVASVTFNERFVKKGKKSRNAKRGLAATIAHEMAHMWFGDLVTMNWWNDLWLNESFATYMAYKAIFEVTEYKEAWRRFSDRKGWAIWEDELPTTHPIEGIVPDTFQARTNFDGISYGKGASVLRQINFLIGEEAFKKGLQHYFKKYANTNTELVDFMNSLQTATPINLNNWQKEWLQTSGVNTFTADWSCEGSQLKEIKIKQSYKKGFPYLRQHKVKLGLIYVTGNNIRVKSMDANVGGAETKFNYPEKTACPVAVDPNYQSYAYSKTRIDVKSLKNINQVLSASNESFLRGEMWQSLWRMVRDGQFSVIQFAQLIENNLTKEKDHQIVDFLGEKVDSVAYYIPKKSKQEKNLHSQFVAKMEKILWQQLKKAKAGSEQQKSLFSSFVSFAKTKYGQNRLESLLKGRQNLRKLKIDQDRRWSLIRALSRTGYGNYENLVARELKRDKSLKGSRSAISARAIHPSLEQKKKWYRVLTSSTNESNFSEFRSIVGNIFPESQYDLQKSVTSDFFNQLLRMENDLNPHFAGSFAWLVPVDCETPTRERVKSFLSQNQKLRPSTKKSLTTAVAESKRCQMIREKARQSLTL